MSSPPVRAADRVSLPAKITYGAASVVDGWANMVPKTMANQVFNMSLGLSPSLISLAFLIFRLYDAITDPVMGWLSDRTRTRWGRRRPYLLIGGIALAVVFPLIWFVPAGSSQTVLTVWLIGGGLILYTCFTVWAMPYQSLLLEMTPDYDERTRVTAWRTYFSKFGALLMGWIWALTQLPVFADPETGRPDTLAGMRAVSLVLAGAILVLATLPFFFVQERYYQQASRTTSRESLPRSLRQTFRNKPFVILLLATVTFSVGTHVTNGFGIYVNTFYVHGGDKTAAAIMAGWVNSVGLVTGLLSVPLFQWLSGRLGKNRTLIVAMVSLSVSSLATWWTFTPSNPWLMLLNAVLASPGMTGMWLIIPSMTADVVDSDELDTGERREGSYAAVYSWIIKASIAIGYGLSGPLLELTGFDAVRGAAQDPAAIVAMRTFNALIPAASMAAALFFIVRYPLSRERMTEIRGLLENRRGTV